MLHLSLQTEGSSIHSQQTRVGGILLSQGDQEATGKEEGEKLQQAEEGKKEMQGKFVYKRKREG